MYSAKRQDNPETAYMFEIYVDNEAYQAHIQSPQYKNFLQKSPAILTDHKRKISVEPQFLLDKRVNQTPNTINNLVIVDVKPEHAQAFKDIVMSEMAQSLQAESGVLAIYAATEQNNPNRWYFYEIYASGSAYQSHCQTPHFQDYLKHTADMTTNRESIAITPALISNAGRSETAVYPRWSSMQFEAVIEIPKNQSINIGKVAPQPLNKKIPKYRGGVKIKFCYL